VIHIIKRTLVYIFIRIRCSRWAWVTNNVQAFAPALGICLIFVSCSLGSRYTEDPKSSVGRLRLELVAFAKGQLESVTGKTEPEEAYILMYGYEKELDSLPISHGLQKKLEAIAPRPTEMYVLARVHGDDIKEYTEWDLGHEDNYHPLLWPMPFMIRGDPFKITATKREPHSVDMKLE